ncbi:hypothetical protein DERP_001570 [Dermatophagoides pteronyssinus]|uniref:Atrial natriuretic peptide-converting enzyme-like n=1 Tax=Dermatophagoides pteronyssinus TaxID=6956 RepID=A0ABQ8JAX2_DERPT|nr:hypothetical protein DERP_001570 [Dermatophagoides pteronyssinus]
MSQNDHYTIERNSRNRNRNRLKNSHIYTVTPFPSSSLSSTSAAAVAATIPPPHVHYQSMNLPGTLTSTIHQQQQQHPQLIDMNNIITAGDPNQNTLIIPQQRQQSIQQDFNPIEFIEQQEQQQQLRWHKNEFCTPCNCMCFFIAFIFLVTALMSGIYYNLNFFDGKHLRERVFKAKFVVRNQDFLLSELENVDSNEFRQFSNMLQKRIDNLFQQSMISRSFVKTEIIAFERKRNSPSETIIHLNVHVSADKSSNVETSDIYLILAEEIVNNRLKIFENLMVDHNSIDVQERRWHPFHRIGGSGIMNGGGGSEKYSMASASGNPWNHKSLFPGMLEGLPTDPIPPPRKCGRIDLQYCRFLPYNQTSYPNFFNHWNLSSIEEEFIQFKELIDSECYSLSKHFICNLLQPECNANNNDDMIILPCRNFCQEFLDSCQKWLPEKLLKKITCSKFPKMTRKFSNDNSVGIFGDNDDDDDSDGNNQNEIIGIWNHQRKKKLCHNKPNCAQQLRLQSQHYKICDGIFDCLDESDESNCTYCSTNDNNIEKFHCGNRQCITMNQTCDNIRDCQNGVDEINCLRLMVTTPSSKSIHTKKLIKWTTISIINEGYLGAISKGKHSFVCSDQQHSTTTTTTTFNMNQTRNNDNGNSNNNHGYYNYDNHTPILGHNICEENYFEKLIQIESKILTPSFNSDDESINFTRFVPGTTLPSPYPIQCKSKQVYYMQCSNEKCGINHIPIDSLTIDKDVDIIETTINNNLTDDDDDDGLKKSYPGYWPWYAKININGHYYCDGTLITWDTIIAQTIFRLSTNNIESKEFRVSSIQQQIIDDNNLNEKHQPTTTTNNVIKIRTTSNWWWTTSSNAESSHKCVIVKLNYEQDMLNHRPVKIVNMEQCRKYLSLKYNNDNNYLNHPYESLQSNYSSQHSSSSSSSPMSMNFSKELNLNDKLCVKFRRKKQKQQQSSSSLKNGNYHPDGGDDWLMNNEQQQQQQQQNFPNHNGRHLYCQTKNQWNLLAFEYYRIFNNKQIDNDKNFILFQIIPTIRII